MKQSLVMSLYLIEKFHNFTEEENNSDGGHCGGKNAPLREQDRFLPIANIAKIMKRAIPTNGKVIYTSLDNLDCPSKYFFTVLDTS